MNDLPLSHREVIQRLGGTPKLTRDLGFKSLSRIQKWHRTNSIPRWHWRLIEAYAYTKGHPEITERLLDDLCTVKAKDNWDVRRVAEVAA